MEKLRSVLKQYWGYDSFLPLQKEAMGCVLNSHDSVVVLPTGGGKSLCFQAPAMCMSGMAVVVSPLISLMKDQVDSLKNCGVPSAFINSSLSLEEKRSVAADIHQGKIKLIYVAPERLVQDNFIAFLKQTKLSFIAVDEAHCISAWGHDFRPEYRELRILKKAFPGISIHAYTATATDHVRSDISQELSLAEPEILVGSFDRPNLVYTVTHRSNKLKQIRSVIDRHKSESGIIYCIRRKDVDDLCAVLTDEGYKALPYHAGMSDEDRKRNQEAFIKEEVDTIVATVAFGMGIDKSNVRYVIHAGMPKSLEHYQQETGRAGRDGLEAECCLFYSNGDFNTWQTILSDSEPDVMEIALGKLRDIYDFCVNGTCRHKAIVSYFGQELDKESCDACDVCLNQVELLEDPFIVSQKILSCIARLKGQFGAAYIGRVLVGSKDQRILQFGHDKLSIWGILSDEGRQSVRIWIDQLISQGYLQREGEFNVISITNKGWQVLKGEDTPSLLKPAEKAEKKSRISSDSWEGVDMGLFNVLRTLRRERADEQNVPAFIVFSDTVLRDMTRRRPSTLGGFLNVSGVGQKKCETYGDDFIRVIIDYCTENSVEMDSKLRITTPIIEQDKNSNSSVIKQRAFNLFKKGSSVKEVAQSIGRALSTTYGYLEEYIKYEGITDPSQWISSEINARILEAIEAVGMDRLRPIFEFFNGEISYDLIRISVVCFRNRRHYSIYQ
jgi:ATP-dependent DNA helicase RecQ